MGKHLVYYAKEVAKFPEAVACGVTIEVAHHVLPKIFAHFGAPAVKMSINPRARSWSWYKPGDGLMSIKGRRCSTNRVQEIVIAKTMMNWRVLAHEVAHALHYWDYDRRYMAAQAKGRTISRERGHGPQHREWMDKVIAFLKATSVIPKSVIEKFGNPVVNLQVFFNDPEVQKNCAIDLVEGDTKTWNEQMRRECMASLAPTSICPRCLKAKTREQFGVRIIRKTPQGRAIKVVKQSYCQDCR